MVAGYLPESYPLFKFELAPDRTARLTFTGIALKKEGFHLSKTKGRVNSALPFFVYFFRQ